MPRQKSTHVDDPQAVGDRLRAARETAGLSQRQLAFSGCSPAYISRIESGDRIPSLQLLRELGRRLGVSEDYLATGSDRASATARLLEAEVALRLDELDLAEDLYTRLRDGAAANGDLSLAHAGLGQVAYRRGDPRAAIDQFEQRHSALGRDEAGNPDLADSPRSRVRDGRRARVGDRRLRALPWPPRTSRDDQLERIRFQLLLGDALIDSGNFGRAEEVLANALADRQGLASTPTCASTSTGRSRACTPSATTARQPRGTPAGRSRCCGMTEDTYRTARAHQLLAHIELDSGPAPRRRSSCWRRAGRSSSERERRRARPVPARGGARAREAGRARRRPPRSRCRSRGSSATRTRRTRRGATRPSRRCYEEMGDSARALELYELAAELLRARAIPTATSPRSTRGWPSCTRPEGNAEAAYEYMKKAVGMQQAVASKRHVLRPQLLDSVYSGCWREIHSRTLSGFGQRSCAASMQEAIRPSDCPVGGNGRLDGRRPPCGSLVRRVVPPPRRRAPPRCSPRAGRDGARSTPRSPRWTRAGRSPSPEWKVEYALMLGLERVLTDQPAAARLRNRAAPPPDRRARRDARRADRPPRGEGRERQRQRQRHRRAGRGARTRRSRGGGRRRVGRGGGREADAPRTTRARSAASASAIRRPPGKTIAAGGFVEAARTMGVLILTHRRLLVNQFTRDLTTEGYGDRFAPPCSRRARSHSARTRSRSRPTRGSRATSTRSRASAYQLVICDEAHTALGEKTSAAIRSFTEPIYIGMTATEQLIAKQVSDVFPASVDDLPLGDAARRGLIAPLRSLRVRPAAAISSVPIVGGDYDQEILAKVLDQEIFNQAAASLYRDRFDDTPGIVYAAGVEHAYNLAREFRAAGLKAEAVSGAHAAREARRDARRLRARRDQRPHQRPAARRGLELAAGDDLHAPRPDGEPPRLPAANRPHHAPRAAQGGRHRRRLRRRRGHAQRPHDHDPQPARLRLLPAGRAGHAGAASPHPAAREAEALARALARAGDARPAPPRRGHHARVGARRPGPPRGRRAAPVGAHRRPPGALRGAPGLRREARPRQPRVPRGVPHELRRREPEPPPAPLRSRRPRRGHRRPRRLRRPRHDGDLRPDLGKGPRPGRPRPPAGDRRREGRGARTTSSRAGPGGSRARPERSRTGARAPTCPRRSACWARSRTRAATATRKTRPAS